MTTNDQIKALMATANDLLARAKDDPTLAEAMMADPAAEISRAAGQPIPAGVTMSATRNETGVIELSADASADFEGELDDALLSQVAGGTTVASSKLDS
jgi:hypothetical protein